ncbi:nibrin [Nephila pilipes]|uniref:Nibrin n=1 Tax=Nephila pilipes TaxID=299642 RepID=A0A8X6Q994_NEPPI|nr:nibrin [Nephila pilipes]
MWKLKHVKKEHLENYVFVGEDFIVGRKDATLLINNDPSVSRRHAVIYVKHPEGNLSDPTKKSSLFLRDEGSKYGTFKNSIRITSEVEIQNNDLVKFEHLENYVFVGEDFIVGRKDATLLINNDPSVSRRHAVIYVKHPEGNLSDPTKKSSLFLRDEGSKYGTFKNSIRITSEVEIQNNDLVKFGQFDSEFRIHNLPLVVTTSCLEISAKKDLKKAIHALGGSFISEWQPSCTHLVMTEVKVTVKALCCLVSTKPIVKPEYFQELKKSLKNSATIILPNRFIPPIGEALIDKDVVSFDINPQRKSLFKNKTFFFLDEKQFKKLHLGIVLGGGNASILSENEITPEILLRDGCCVIEPMQQGQEASILSSVRAILQKKEYRMIPESDIGLSVAYCSTDKFCNPQFNMVEVLLSQKMQSQTLSQREVYVPDTQERSFRIENKSRKSVTDVFSSLHLSSFQNDAVEEMEVSEVPISAQIKQELDGIFEEPFERKVESPPKVDVFPTVSSPSTSHRILKQEIQNVDNQFENEELVEKIPKREKRNAKSRNENIPPNKSIKREKQSILQQNENHSEFGMHSPSKCNGASEVNNGVNWISPQKKKSDITSPRTFSIQNNVVPEEVELPRNLAVIKYAELLHKKVSFGGTETIAQSINNSKTKNFKKFRKVHPLRAQTLPRIIGAHELAPFDKVIAEISNGAWDDPPEEMSQPVKGEFDW